MMTTKVMNDDDMVKLKVDAYFQNGGGTKDYNELENKPKINGVELDGDLSTNDLHIDQNFVKDDEYVHTDNNYTTDEKDKLASLYNYNDSELKQEIVLALNDKVDKEENKGLSTKDFTDDDKLKLDTLENYDDTNIRIELYGKADKNEIPDVSGFITNSVDYLVHYYKKNETYTQNEINELIGGIENVSIQIVDELPQTGQTNIIYFVLKEGTTNDIYDEFIYINGEYEQIGTTQIDLSDYALKREVPTSNSQLTNDEGFITNDALDDYATTEYVDDAISNAKKTFFLDNSISFNDLQEKVIEIVNYELKNPDKKYDIIFLSDNHYYRLGCIYKNLTTSTKIIRYYFSPKVNPTSTKMTYEYYKLNIPYIKIEFGVNQQKNEVSYVSSFGRDISNYTLPKDNYLLSAYNNYAYNVSNDYTPAHKKYVDESITSALENYEYDLPIASSDTLGGIKVGKNLSIDENGVLSAKSSDDGKTSIFFLTNNSSTNDYKALLKCINEQKPFIAYYKDSSSVYVESLVYYNIGYNTSKLYFSGQPSSATNRNGIDYSIDYNMHIVELTGQSMTTTNPSVMSKSITTQSNYYIKNTNQLIGKDNTTEFTPTGDYNPATKKYVDDMIGNINNVLATLVDVEEGE